MVRIFPPYLQLLKYGIEMPRYNDSTRIGEFCGGGGLFFSLVLHRVVFLKISPFYCHQIYSAAKFEISIFTLSRIPALKRLKRDVLDHQSDRKEIEEDVGGTWPFVSR